MAITPDPTEPGTPGPVFEPAPEGTPPPSEPPGTDKDVAPPELAAPPEEPTEEPRLYLGKYRTPEDMEAAIRAKDAEYTRAADELREVKQRLGQIERAAPQSEQAAVYEKLRAMSYGDLERIKSQVDTDEEVAAIEELKAQKMKLELMDVSSAESGRNQAFAAAVKLMPGLTQEASDDRARVEKVFKDYPELGDFDRNPRGVLLATQIAKATKDAEVGRGLGATDEARRREILSAGALAPSGPGEPPESQPSLSADEIAYLKHRGKYTPEGIAEHITWRRPVGGSTRQKSGV